VLKGFSGSIQSQLKTALKFLGLVDEANRPTDKLNALVEAKDPEKWKEALQAVLREAYPAIFDKLATVSPSEFNETFKKAYPAEGETLRKGTTFFLTAAQEAGVSISPFLLKNKKPRSNNGRRKAPRSEAAKGQERASKGSANNQGTTQSKPELLPPRSMAEQLLAKFPEFNPDWTPELQAKWFDGYQKLLAMENK
jgi:hypothetical protein